MSYCARSDIEAVFGAENVKQWADLDNNNVGASITLRITTAITYAQAEIDDRLRGGHLTIPLSEPPPTTVVDIAAKLAGVWLYEARGVQDYNPETGAPVHRLQWHKRDAGQKLKEIRTGVRRLDLTEKPMAPEFVEHETNDDDL